MKRIISLNDLFSPIEEAPVFASIRCDGTMRDVRQPHKKALVAGDKRGGVGAGYHVFTAQQSVTL